MTHYTPPLNDMMFLLHDVLRLEDYNTLPSLSEATPDIIPMILSEAGKIASDILHPLNAVGDLEGCRLKDGIVSVPNGFEEAYEQYVIGGWASLNCHSVYGGQNMPIVLGNMVAEMCSAANMAFTMYFGLTHGAYSAIYTHGSEAQKNLYLPKLATGEWMGTMNLTESHCGSDLGLLRTKAVPCDDNSYKITGEKIFISSGDHQMAKNIIHLVLARLPDAPAGVKGISLFLVPKFLVKPDGVLGERNTVTCSKLEEKMGIHGNATCVMNFDEASGYLVGEPNAGLKAMFVMMNEARLGVAVQGLSQSDIAMQNAVDYAKNRLQGRSLTGIQFPDKPADPIIVHPDIRHSLMTMRAFNEGARAFVAELGLKLDLYHHHPDATFKETLDDYISLMTPIAKGYITDKAFENCVKAQQIYGGHGYIKEHGVEQFVRDSRIAMIYEGTNGIQALDLVLRKMPKHNGRAVIAYHTELQNFITDNKDNALLKEFLTPLQECKNISQQACLWMMQYGMKDAENAGAGATSMMHLFGITVLSYGWAKMAKIALEKLANFPENADFYEAKLVTGRYFNTYFVPEIHCLLAKIKAGKEGVMALKTEMF